MKSPSSSATSGSSSSSSSIIMSPGRTVVSQPRNLQRELGLFFVFLGVSFVALIGIVEFDSHLQHLASSSSQSSSGLYTPPPVHGDTFHHHHQHHHQHHENSNKDDSSSSSSGSSSSSSEDETESERLLRLRHQQQQMLQLRHQHHGSAHFHHHNLILSEFEKQQHIKNESFRRFLQNNQDPSGGLDSSSKHDHHHDHNNNHNNHSAGGNKSSQRLTYWHPLFPLFRFSFVNAPPSSSKGAQDQAVNRRFSNWDRAHPPPSKPNCTRRMIHHVEPVFHNPKPDIAIFTIHSINLTSDSSSRRRMVGRASIIPLMYYCKMHRYDLIVEDEKLVDPRRTPHWSKIRGLRKWLPHYKWIVWMDMDVIITNLNQTLEYMIRKREKVIEHENDKALELARSRWRSRQTHHPFTPPEPRPLPQIIIGNDWNGINSGIMFLRNGSFTLGFLKRMWGIPQVLANPFYDQGSLVYLVTRGRRGRDDAAADYDYARLDICDEFNRYPMGLLLFGRNLEQIKWKPGNWLIHFASCKFFPKCVDWMDAMDSIAGCGFDLPHLAPNYTMQKPFYRTDLDAVAPDFNEPLEPYPTQLKQFVFRPFRMINHRVPTLRPPHSNKEVFKSDSSAASSFKLSSSLKKLGGGKNAGGDDEEEDYFAGVPGAQKKHPTTATTSGLPAQPLPKSNRHNNNNNHDDDDDEDEDHEKKKKKKRNDDEDGDKDDDDGDGDHVPTIKKRRSHIARN